MTDASASTPAPVAAIKKDRSPSFPFITLTKAIERTRELFQAARRHEMRLPDAAAAMNYAPKSSGAIQTLAALIAFGLVDDNGSGDARKFKITDLAFKMLEDQRPGAREAALAEAAVSPKAIAEYLAKWGHQRPADGICVSELRIEGGFTEDGAKLFLRVFDDAVGYAKVAGSGKQSDTSGDGRKGVEPPNPELAIGDWVQVESNGQIVFEKTRVRAIQHPWVFVEASKSGADMSDVTLLEKAPAGEQAIPPVLEFEPRDGKSASGEEMDRFTVDEGVVKVAFPFNMSADSVDELEAFFALFIKKAKRRATAFQK